MPKIQRKKKTIILVEDEQIMVDLLAKKLKDAGYLVKVAKDGASGLDLIRKVKPDLILLDMLLPVLDGFGVLEKLSAEKLLPKLPVIVISNTGQPIEIERVNKLGVRDYLVKVNFDPTELLVKVNHILK